MQPEAAQQLPPPARPPPPPSPSSLQQHLRLARLQLEQARCRGQQGSQGLLASGSSPNAAPPARASSRHGGPACGSRDVQSPHSSSMPPPNARKRPQAALPVASLPQAAVRPAAPTVQRLDSADCCVLEVLQRAAAFEEAAPHAAGPPRRPALPGSRPRQRQPTSPLARQLAALRGQPRGGDSQQAAPAAGAAAGDEGAPVTSGGAPPPQGQGPLAPVGWQQGQAAWQQQAQQGADAVPAAAELLEHCRQGR